MYVWISECLVSNGVSLILLLGGIYTPLVLTHCGVPIRLPFGPGARKLRDGGMLVCANVESYTASAQTDITWINPTNWRWPIHHKRLID